MKKVRIDQVVWSAKRHIQSCGIPINIKLGDYKEQADWVANLIEQAAEGGEFFDDAKEAEQSVSREEQKLTEAAGANLLELSPEMSNILLKAAKLVKKEIATGTRRSNSGYEMCPVCGETVGQSGFYCKHCGQKLRHGKIDF